MSKITNTPIESLALPSVLAHFLIVKYFIHHFSLLLDYASVWRFGKCLSGFDVIIFRKIIIKLSFLEE